MKNILYAIRLLIGKKTITLRNKKVFIRKRIFHSGYQISLIVWNGFYKEELYYFQTNVNTLEDVNVWLRTH